MQVFINRIAELIIKHLEDTLTSDEKSELDIWRKESGENQALFDSLTNPAQVAAQLEKYYAYDAEKGWARIMQQHQPDQDQSSAKTFSISWKRWIAAASILLIAGLIYWTTRPSSAPAIAGPGADTTIQQDVKAPLLTKATITLSDGKLIIVDTASGSVLMKDEHLNIIRMDDGSVKYDVAATAGSVQYNTLNNPRGSRVINLILSDGSRVWLNSESSLRYPVAFGSDKREVEITGEAYFEVAKVAGKKFFVKAGNSTTEVLGTHFNINSYSDEANIKVTLLEGAVQVSSTKGLSKLAPGQQAQVTNEIHIIDNVNTDEVVAWKNEMFSFNGADIHAIMRQVSRWYDVEVIIKDAIEEKFVGELPRSVNVSSLLKMLETTGAVKFKIEPGKIEVMNRK